MLLITAGTYQSLVRAAHRLLRYKQPQLAADVARVALDLTQHGVTEVLHISPKGLSLGDRVRIRTRQQRLPKDTPGNVVGFSKGKLLVLFFPATFPAGTLAQVDEADVLFLSKPTVIGPWALTDEVEPAAHGPGKPSVIMPGGTNAPVAPALPSAPITPAPAPPKHTARVLEAALVRMGFEVVRRERDALTYLLQLRRRTADLDARQVQAQLGTQFGKLRLRGSFPQPQTLRCAEFIIDFGTADDVVVIVDRQRPR